MNFRVCMIIFLVCYLRLRMRHLLVLFIRGLVIRNLVIGDLVINKLVI